MCWQLVYFCTEKIIALFWESWLDKIKRSHWKKEKKRIGSWVCYVWQLKSTMSSGYFGDYYRFRMLLEMSMILLYEFCDAYHFTLLSISYNIWLLIISSSVFLPLQLNFLVHLLLVTHLFIIDNVLETFMIIYGSYF